MDIWQLCPLLAATDGHVPKSHLGTVDMSPTGPESDQGFWACPPLAASNGHVPKYRLGAVDRSLAGREQRTYGSYVHCRLRAMDIFHCPAGKERTCPSLAPGEPAHPGQGRWTCPPMTASTGHMATMSIPGREQGT